MTIVVTPRTLITGGVVLRARGRLGVGPVVDVRVGVPGCGLPALGVLAPPPHLLEGVLPLKGMVLYFFQ